VRPTAGARRAVPTLAPATALLLALAALAPIPALAAGAEGALSAGAEGARTPSAGALVFPFGDSLWLFPGADGSPERVARLAGASFAKSWDLAKDGTIVAADTRQGRIVAIGRGDGLGAATEPRAFYKGNWSWAGAGAGLVAAASREFEKAFAYRVERRGGAVGAALAGGAPLDCFASDALFLPGRVLVAGATAAGDAFSVWLLEAPGGGDGPPTSLLLLPREGGFLRLAGGESGAYCFVSARSRDSAAPLSIWKLPDPKGAPKGRASRIEPRFAAPGALAWFGSGWLGEDRRLYLPLSLGGGSFALSIVDPATGREKARMALPSPLYQRLGRAGGRELAVLYDHAAAPGRFRLASIDLGARGLAVYELR
jgi:hypothetical protein